MIEGVKTKTVTKHSDDRGFFMELLREDDEMFQRFGQASMSMTFPGVIKAFHYHEHQDDIWFFPQGQAQIVLHDLRQHSATYKQTEVYYMGEFSSYLLFIPRGVAHGYRVLGPTAATILYFTNTSYDLKSPDEFRIAYDDPTIAFDWQTFNR